MQNQPKYLSKENALTNSLHEKFLPLLKRNSVKTAWRIVKYMIVRLINISLTIVASIFIVILLFNRTGVLDWVVKNDVDKYARGLVNKSFAYIPYSPEYLSTLTAELTEEAGLNLPFIPRHLRWTFNALTFNWGEVQRLLYDPYMQPLPNKIRVQNYNGNDLSRYTILQIIPSYLPNTLLLVGTANLIIFLVGLPLSLYLARRPGNWLDRLIVSISPISSIPSWILGIFLVAIFAKGLHILPLGGMYDLLPPQTKWGYIFILLKHMALPLTALLLNLFLQCVYTWRTFFSIYANEDYVEFAVAKGVPARRLERDYILRPTLPYIITSFGLTLISFWQITTTLEIVFNWPGIGFLYRQSLRTGDMMIIVGLVVIFAYLLGLMLLGLDFAYVLADPRIRVGGGEQSIRARLLKKRSFLKIGTMQRIPGIPKQAKQAHSASAIHKVRYPIVDLGRSIRNTRNGFNSFMRELTHYPSAFFGMVMVIFILVTSVLSPWLVSVYEQKQQEDKLWVREQSGKQTIAVGALPAWVNWFRKNDLPPTILLDSRDGSAQKNVVIGEDGNKQISITFQFAYPYSEYPHNAELYFYTSATEKLPFVSLTWIYPDGTEVSLKPIAVSNDEIYRLSDSIPSQTLASHRLSSHFISNVMRVAGDEYEKFYALFTDPALSEPVVMQGMYTLRIDCLTFEPDSDLDAELVLVGKIYGPLGTGDWSEGIATFEPMIIMGVPGSGYLTTGPKPGTDLLIPILRGAPITMILGLGGAFLTTIVALLVAAAGTWFGGWVDNLIQRITEAMIVMPFLAVGLVLLVYYNANIWLVLFVIVVLNAFGSPVKSYRSALLQVKNAAYVEAAQTYGASNWRIIRRYLVPRIMPVIIPQIVILIPSYVFLDATLALFGFKTLNSWGSLYSYWPGITLMVLTGISFILLGSALDKILNPHLVRK